MKLLAETCDIARKFKLFEEFQVSVEKKLLEPEAAQYQALMGKFHRTIISMEIR